MLWMRDRHGGLGHRGLGEFSANTGEALRVILLQEINEAFADEAAEVPGVAGVAGVH